MFSLRSLAVAPLAEEERRSRGPFWSSIWSSIARLYLTSVFLSYFFFLLKQKFFSGVPLKFPLLDFEGVLVRRMSQSVGRGGARSCLLRSRHSRVLSETFKIS